MTRIRHVAVVLPARDESDDIEATIESIERARQRLPVSVTSTCVIVLDAGPDAAGAVIERRTGSGPEGGRWTSSIVVRAGHGGVGAARSVGCRVALGGSLHQAGNVWLAHTDADTIVPGYWLRAHLELAERDVAAVAGTIEPDDGLDDAVRAAFDASYAVVSADGTRHHVHGANMGTRGDAYLLAGGWRRLESGEEHDLWERLGAVTTCVTSNTITVHRRARAFGP